MLFVEQNKLMLSQLLILKKLSLRKIMLLYHRIFLNSIDVYTLILFIIYLLKDENSETF